jgi:hypothetical protein
MQEIEDERWRRAARALQMDLVAADGKIVPNERGTQGDAMRGRIDGRRINVRYGARDASDRTTVIAVALRRTLLLGLETQVYRDPAPASNRYGVVPRSVFSGLKSIDEGRARALFDETSEGRDLWGRLHHLGSLGWVELTDTHLRVQAEVFADSAAGWVELIQGALQAASLAEAAREELPNLPWEIRLLDSLDVERERLSLDMDRRSFQLTGAIGSLRISVKLVAEDGRYGLVYGVRFAPPLPKGERLASRAPRSLLARLWHLGRSKANGSWEDSIEASPLVRGRLSAKQLDRVAALSRLGHVAIDGSDLTLRCFDLEVGQGGLLDDLVDVASAFAGGAAEPYRG